MKLGIIGDWSEEGFRYVNGKGLKMVEFCVNHNVNSAEFAALVPSINEWQKKYDVKVGSMGRWGSERILPDGSINPAALQDDFTLVDAASQLGCPVYNIGCNYIQDMNYNQNCENAIAYFTKVLDYAKGRNVKIATYNCDWSNFVFNEDAWKNIHTVLPELGIKYDISHCRGRRGDYLKEIRDWGERFYHFHVKGTIYVDGEGYDDAPAGLDQTDWPTVFAMLHTKGYEAMASIEPHSSKWKGEMGEWGVDYTINYMRPFMWDKD